MAIFDDDTFPFSADQSKNLANQGDQIIEFYHIPSGRSVRFKAFLTQFDDTYSSAWSSETAYGRMDPMQSFQQTSRTISIAFDVVAGSKEEALKNLDRISLLLQMLYPSYEQFGGTSTIKAAPYFKMSFMNLASNTVAGGHAGAQESGLLGTLEGLTYSPDLEMGFFQEWDQVFAKEVNLSCNFTVLHQNELGWMEKEQRRDFNTFPYGRDVDTWKPPPDEPVGPLPKTEEQIKKQGNEEMLAAKSMALLSSTTTTTQTTKKFGKIVSQSTTVKSSVPAKNAMGQTVGSPPIPPTPSTKPKPDWKKLLKERQKKIDNAGGW